MYLIVRFLKKSTVKLGKYGSSLRIVFSIKTVFNLLTLTGEVGFTGLQSELPAWNGVEG